MTSPSPVRRRSLLPLYAIMAICLAPLVFALAAYYLPSLGLRPAGQANYGHLIQPQRPVPDAAHLQLETLAGQPFDLQSLRGRWVLVNVDSGACSERCVRKLFILRNSHASQGKNVDRISRVWFIDDDHEPSIQIQQAYQGTHMLKASSQQLQAFLPGGTVLADTPGTQDLHAGMWVIDPNGNVMLVFPPDADPLKVRRDISKLLYNSRIG